METPYEDLLQRTSETTDLGKVLRHRVLHERARRFPFVAQVRSLEKRYEFSGPHGVDRVTFFRIDLSAGPGAPTQTLGYQVMPGFDPVRLGPRSMSFLDP